MPHALPAVWNHEGKTCHGELVLEPDALYLICLDEEGAGSRALAAGGAAAARQFGLLGALVGAAVGTGVDAVKEKRRQTRMAQATQDQAHLSPAERAQLHPSSRSVRAGELTTLRRPNAFMAELVTTRGTVVLQGVSAQLVAAIEGWCAAVGAPVEVVPVPVSKPMSPRTKKILLITPVALAATYFLLMVPFALSLAAHTRSALAAYDQLVATAGPAAEAAKPTGRALQASCGDVLSSMKPEEMVAYVGKLPPNGEAMLTKDYYGFPRYTHVRPPYYDGGEVGLESDGLLSRWRPTGSFGEAYGKLIEQLPFDWPRVSQRYGMLPRLDDTRWVFAARVVSIEPSSGAVVAAMAVKVLERESGKVRCEGDLLVSVPGSDFTLSQGIPFGVVLPTCASVERQPCRDAARYASLIRVPGSARADGR